MCKVLAQIQLSLIVGRGLRASPSVLLGWLPIQLSFIVGRGLRASPSVLLGWLPKPMNPKNVSEIDLDRMFLTNIGTTHLVNSTLNYQTHNPGNLLILKILVQTSG